MRSSFILAAALLAPAPLLADGTTWYGCGATFNTCASAEITAQQLPSGRWELNITVTNLSHEAGIEAYRNSLLTELRITGGGDADLLGVSTATGDDVTGDFRVRPGSRGAWTVQGFTERRAAGGDVWRKQVGGYSTECAATDSCDALRATDSGRTQFGYYSGPITFRVELDEWNEDVSIAVFQGRIGGRDGQEEHYELDQQTTVTPEPGTMALLATGLAGLAARNRRRRKAMADE